MTPHEVLETHLSACWKSVTGAKEFILTHPQIVIDALIEHNGIEDVLRSVGGEVDGVTSSGKSWVFPR